MHFTEDLTASAPAPPGVQHLLTVYISLARGLMTSGESPETLPSHPEERATAPRIGSSRETDSWSAQSRARQGWNGGRMRQAPEDTACLSGFLEAVGSGRAGEVLRCLALEASGAKLGWTRGFLGCVFLEFPRPNSV